MLINAIKIFNVFIVQDKKKGELYLFLLMCTRLVPNTVVAEDKFRVHFIAY